MFQRIHHIAILLGGPETDLDEAAEPFEESFGVPRSETVEFGYDNIDVALYSTGETIIELMTVTDEEGWPYEHLAAHGPGFFHIAFEVDDIHERKRQLEEMGFSFIDEIHDGVDWKVVTLDYEDTPLPMQLVEDDRPLEERQ